MTVLVCIGVAQDDEVHTRDTGVRRGLCWVTSTASTPGRALSISTTVGPNLLDLGDGALPITGGPGNNYVRLVVEQGFKARPREVVAVGDQEPDLVRPGGEGCEAGRVHQ
jgi:hypothetical protein